MAKLGQFYSQQQGSTMNDISDDRRKQLMMEARKTIKSKNINMEPEIFEAMVLKLYKELLEKEKSNVNLH